jgi:hypothetical protein
MIKGDVLFFLILFLASSLAVYAQFKLEELAARPQWESFLKKVKIIKSESIGEGVTKSKKLFFCARETWRPLPFGKGRPVWGLSFTINGSVKSPLTAWPSFWGSTWFLPPSRGDTGWTPDLSSSGFRFP